MILIKLFASVFLRKEITDPAAISAMWSSIKLSSGAAQRNLAGLVRHPISSEFGFLTTEMLKIYDWRNINLTHHENVAWDLAAV